MPPHLRGWEHRHLWAVYHSNHQTFPSRGWVGFTAFSPDGKQVFGGGPEGLTLWNLKTRKATFDLAGPPGDCRHGTLSLDGKVIVGFSTGQNAAQVRDANDGRIRFLLKGHTHPAYGAAISPDGKQIVTASEDSTLKVWDARTGRELRTLKGHTGVVTCVAYSPDRLHILSGGTAVGLALFAVNLATAIAVCLWIYRAYDNLASLRAAGRRYSPGWAVGSFFIPVLNLFRPCQVVQEIWRASDPAAPAEDRYAWQGRPGSVLVGLWWAFWLVSDILGGILFRMGLSPNPAPDEDKVVALLSALDDGFAVPAALLLALVIYRIRVRQAEKHAHILAARDGGEGAEETDDER
jgi:hypothetical protein